MSEQEYKNRIEELENELNTLNMRYLSQVSLWKSRYEELQQVVDCTKNVFKGDFDDIVTEYCRKHSKLGNLDDFSRVPMDCAYQIAFDTVTLLVEYLKTNKKIV